MTPQTLETLITEHQAMIYRYLRYLGTDTATSEDLTQDTFLAAFQSRKTPSFDDIPGTSKWLRAIARNMFHRFCRDHARNKVMADRQYLDRAEAVWDQTFLRDSDGFDYTEALRKCLNALSPKQREVLNLHYEERKSRKEIAGLIAMTEDGVKSLLQRIRAALGLCVERRLAKDGPP
jgi:RNA polymerase sigma-70 factor, ECF subfamily